jgi:hypothetical protein
MKEDMTFEQNKEKIWKQLYRYANPAMRSQVCCDVRKIAEENGHTIKNFRAAYDYAYQDRDARYYFETQWHMELPYD